MSTKYLSSFIDGFQIASFQHGTPDRYTPQPSARDVQAEELKQILLDAKEGIEVKNTTHEFYETLERITNELRGMTEHSTAFLSRVRKSDAPDYFNIIKNPMDLGTVLKKVKAQQYKDKSSFKADLDLIWDNCLLYNTLPNHPLRRSAMTLRSRANHLLEFVTDPVASTPAPQVIHSQSASRFDRPGSRLDALDASHVVISTANLLGEPKGAPEYEQRQTSPIDLSYRDGSLPLKHEEKEESVMYDDDFQDADEDEEDESIKTRKGLTSQKSQPGGGRNLELLKGLAAPDPSAESTPVAESALSIYPSGLDIGAPSSSRSPLERSITPPGPSSANASGLPDLPGTYPGQGSALLARRATGASNLRDRRIKTRTPSMPPAPATIPLAERAALRRTPDMMSRFTKLATNPDISQDEGLNTLPAVQNSSHANGLSVLISSALANDFSTRAADPSGSTTPSKLIPDPPILHQGDADLDWWQTVCSDTLLANGVPEVPAVACKRPKSARRQAAESGPSRRQQPNPCWNDLCNLRKIKRTHHKLAVIRRDAPGVNTDADVRESDSSDGESYDHQEGNAATDTKQKSLLELGASNMESGTAAMGQLALQIVCSTILEHAGFDSVQRSALSNISSLLRRYILSLGSAAAYHRDHHAGTPSLGSILKKALHDVAADDSFPAGRDPLSALAQYRDVDVPQHSQDLASLTTRLASTYEHEIDEAERSEPKLKLEKDVQELDSLSGEDEDGETDAAEHRTSYALVRMLLEAENDHLGLQELRVPADTGFPLHLLYASLLRQSFPSSCGDLSRPFEPPPPFVSLVPLSDVQTREEAVESTIGLLQPFLQARSLSAYDLYDDDDLPLAVQADVQKALVTRPDVPYTTGRVVLGKRKREIAPPAPAPASIGLNLATGSAFPSGAQGRPVQTGADKPKKVKAV